MAQASAAFTRVAAALLRYQTAFLTARTEAQAAIADAAAAEQATVLARTKHQQAAKAAAQADPGTPAATPPVYSDPGAMGLLMAQSRLATAQMTLLAIGNEVTAEIHAAAGTTSNAPPEITEDGWDVFWNSPFGRGPLLHAFPQLDPIVSGFFKGFTSAAWDTIVGLNELIQAMDPAQRLIRDLRNFLTGGPDALFKQYMDDTHTLIAIGSDPLGALREVWRQISAEDLWATHPAEATGRVTFEILSLVVPAAKAGAVSKLGNAAEAAAQAAARMSRMTNLLRNSKGITVSGERVLVNGVDKMSLGELSALYDKSTHNMGAGQATLGRFIPGNSKSYEQIAQQNGDAHFNLKNPGWQETRNTYNLSDEALYELLNKPFLDEIVAKGMPVRFTDNPAARPGSAVDKELKYLEMNGYEYNPRTGFATYEGR